MKNRPQKGNYRWSSILYKVFTTVPAEGIEPTLPFENKILSLARLPISPRRLLCK